jgi:hypothetical protein
MKNGDVLGGYVLTTDPQPGGGHSEWAFARKDGEDFFLKRFLQPTFPLPEAPGSENTKRLKRTRCDSFERHQRQVMSKLRPIAGEGGNLVVTKAFFRDKAFYYKVTAKVDISNVGPAQIAAIPRDERILIMLTAVKSLDTLHKAGLVHGDVKPENLLIKELTKGHFAVKVIDFDNAFLAQHPPIAEQLVGDPAYYSPELLRYNIGEGAASQLNDKSDVFALGLVFWQYLTGARPSLPRGVIYPAEAVAAGTVLVMPRAVKDRPLAELVTSMLVATPGDRPSMAEVHSGLKRARRSEPGAKSAGPAAARPEVRKPDISGVLGGKFFRTHPAGAVGFAGRPAKDPGLDGTGVADPAPAAAPAAEAPAAAAADDPPSELRGSLLKKAADAAAKRAKDGAAEGKAAAGELRGKLLKRKE